MISKESAVAKCNFASERDTGSSDVSDTRDKIGTVILSKKFLYTRRRIDHLAATATRVPEQEHSRPLHA
jgi:hypothetical protein